MRWSTVVKRIRNPVRQQYTLVAMAQMSRTLVVLAGPSGSGKSTLAHALAEAWPWGSAGVLALDRYYLDLSHLPFEERAKANFDAPAAIDWQRLRADLQDWTRTGALAPPEYDFSAHVRRAEWSPSLCAVAVVLEGLLALHDPSIRSMAALAVYVDAPDALCCERRERRDVLERGRSPESVRTQYERWVRPMAERFVFPTRRFAHIIVRGDAATSDGVEAILAQLRAERNAPNPYPRPDASET
jgi:uridine kinase